MKGKVYDMNRGVQYLQTHHLLQFLTPIFLIVGGVGGLLQVLHVVGQQQVSQGQEVTMILGIQYIYLNVFRQKTSQLIVKEKSLR